MTAHFTDEETEPRIQSFRNAKVAGKTIKQDVRVGGPGEEGKVGLVERLGLFWISSGT